MRVCLIYANFSTIVALEFARWLRKEKKYGGRNVLSSDCNMQMRFHILQVLQKNLLGCRASSGETNDPSDLSLDLADSGTFKRKPWEILGIFLTVLEESMMGGLVVCCCYRH